MLQMEEFLEEIHMAKVKIALECKNRLTKCDDQKHLCFMVLDGSFFSQSNCQKTNLRLSPFDNEKYEDHFSG